MITRSKTPLGVVDNLPISRSTIPPISTTLEIGAQLRLETKHKKLLRAAEKMPGFIKDVFAKIKPAFCIARVAMLSAIKLLPQKSIKPFLKEFDIDDEVPHEEFWQIQDREKGGYPTFNRTHFCHKVSVACRTRTRDLQSKRLDP